MYQHISQVDVMNGPVLVSIWVQIFFNNLTKAGSATEIILKSLLEKKPLLITWFFLNQRNIVLKLFITVFFFN